MMTLQEARAYIAEATKKGSILGLQSIKCLLVTLSDLEGRDLTKAVPVIHIAGTNGKGSVGAFLSTILKEEGIRVGRYTSPAVFSPFEVWRINGDNISEEDYCQMVSQVKKACDLLVDEHIFPTVFEIETAMAFLYFARKKVDVLLLEVGMGGREDATNVVDNPLCQVITTISRDHMAFLGESLSQIAYEKGGIIKKNSVTFSAMQEPEVEEVLNQIVKEEKAEIFYVNGKNLHFISESPEGLTFSYEGIEYFSKLAGLYQIKNAALAIDVAEFVLKKLKKKNGSYEEVIQKGIVKTYWPGRFELVRKNPYFIIDGAHNEDAAIWLAKSVENCFTNKKITYIMGVLADKEHEKMLKIMLPFADKVYTVTPDNPRAMDGKLLAEEARKYHANVIALDSLEEAVELTKNEDTLAFGSLSYLGALRELIQ